MKLKAKLNLSGQHWHFVGILGTGMRHLAAYSAECGARVTGSDLRSGPEMKDLVEQGINVRLRQDGSCLDRSVDLVVISQAISDDNRELMEARRLGLEVVRYPELLGLLMDVKTGVAVTGSHGKSTTAAAIAYMMRGGGLDPSFIIGAEVPQLGGCAHRGKGKFLVAEACEYKRSFLYMYPKVGVITNIDMEHVDYYCDLEDIQEAFLDFVSQIDSDGFVVVNADDPNSRCIIEHSQAEVVTYGIGAKKADYRAQRVWRAKKHSNFNLTCKGKNRGRFSIQLYGMHNISNTLAAIATCHRLGVEVEQMQELLSQFQGTSRRLQLLGEPWNVAILDDYAHHPREIRASIAATKQRFPNRRLFCVFQPHQHSRTRAMLSELADAFEGVWTTLVSDIYAARDTEEDRQAIGAIDLVRTMNDRGAIAYYVPEFPDVEDILTGDVVPGDVVLVMGAGDIWQVAHHITEGVELKGRRQIAA